LRGCGEVFNEERGRRRWRDEGVAEGAGVGADEVGASLVDHFVRGHLLHFDLFCFDRCQYLDVEYWVKLGFSSAVATWLNRTAGDVNMDCHPSG